MIRFFLVITLLCSISQYSSAGILNLKDSIGIEKKDGKSYILHKVEAKETFYSISRRYNVSIDDIVNNNMETREGLKTDHVIWIPYKENNATAAAKANVPANNTKDLPKGTIVHQVKPSETLYSIARLYNVKLDDVKSWNNLSGHDLNIGQELLIMAPSASEPAINSNNSASTTTSLDTSTADASQGSSGKNEARVVHTVEPSQTLFSISRLYNVSVEDIKNWNNLETSELSVGQKLTVRKKSEQEAIAEQKVEKKPDFIANDNKLAKENFEDYESSAQRTSKAEGEKTEKLKPVQPSANISGGAKIVELGFAEVIDGTDDTKKFRALHKTAPVGTIIQVRNEMNNLSVFVRVLGTLPNTGANDKVLIKITKAAYERLGAIDSRFPVEISYVP